MKSNILIVVFSLLLVIALMSIGGCGGKKNLAYLSSEELFTEGKALFEQQKYIKAVEYFQTIIYNFPGESVVDTAQYFLGLSYFEADEYELAQVEFNRLVVNYPSSVYFPHSIFMKAVCYFEGTPDHYGLDQSDLYTAIKQFEDFIIDFPESELVPDAQQYILTAKTRLAHKFYNGAVVYERKGVYKSAIIYFQKVIDDYTDTEYADDAAYGIARMEYKLKNYDEAARKFSNFMSIYPDHKHFDDAVEYLEKSRYKSAELAFKKKDLEDASTKFQLYLEEYPDSDKTDDARDYLKKIDGMRSTAEAEDEDKT